MIENIKIIEKLEKIDNLPTIAAVISKLNEAMANKNAGAKELADIISDDPSIMTRVLKLVKTSYYAPATGKEISSVQLAITRLGFPVLKNIVLTTSVFTAFKNTKYKLFDPNEFWRHTISTGFASTVINKYAKIAEENKKVSEDLLHISGLLHDIGKIILQEYFPEEFEKSLELSQEKMMPLYQAETEIMGANHADIGGWLARKWGLDKELIDVIELHHYPTKVQGDLKPLISLVHIADYICNYKKIGFSGNFAAPVYSSKIWNYLNLSIEEIPKIVEDVEKEFQHSQVLLSLL